MRSNVEHGSSDRTFPLLLPARGTSGGGAGAGQPAGAGHAPAGPRCTSVEVDRDVLRVDVLLDPLAPALAAEAGVLDAAERRRSVGDDPLVEADHAGLQ